ncbi:ATP-binding cassette domain-containing protein [Vulgatibacter incomptus]|uniref:ABC-type multidrug transport system, ATPase component n=1 Tax=Vulgatibacter incomptus TaxID=1391653 RepID=A0A0K1PFP8_9BACT|nr:ATP-binding cassette domain-containing protein [Vulgatibacter incomptus]AKU92345.1 ABC-type multidrug transport system, ATPase component [Vulgatibacter incomptus]
MRTAVRESESAIRVEGLEKRFGSTVALAGVELEVKRGTILGLLGPNGAGKTTTVRVLTTLLRPDAGRAVVAGFDVATHAQEVRRRIGLAGQQAAVDEYLSGRANLEMIGRLYHLGAAVARRRADELIERFSLTDSAHRIVKTYSGGMRRRLDLAASLVAAPEILFLDEPTTGLDPRSRRGMWEVIEELVRRGTTLLLTTQYLDEADQLADEIVVIDTGRVVAKGEPEQLKRQIGGERIDLQIRDAAQLAGASRLLRGAIGREPDVDAEARRLTAPAPEGVAQLLAVARALESAGIQVEDLALRRPTLDEVFMKLTGHAAVANMPGRAA